MSTHNICFCEKIRKIFTCNPYLTGAMGGSVNDDDDDDDLVLYIPFNIVKVILRGCQGDNERC